MSSSSGIFASALFISSRQSSRSSPVDSLNISLAVAKSDWAAFSSFQAVLISDEFLVAAREIAQAFEVARDVRFRKLGLDRAEFVLKGVQGLVEGAHGG